MSYQQEISTVGDVCSRAGDTWKDISPEYAARMRAQNKLQTGLDIARYTAAIMRKDMAGLRQGPEPTTRSPSVAGTASSVSRS
jgi:isocitrate lyase